MSTQPDEKFIVRDLRNGFIWISTTFFDNYVNQLQPSSVVVYLALARMANNDTQKCYPSQERLAKMIGLSRRSIASCLQELRDKKLVEWKQGIEGKANEYYLLEPGTCANFAHTPVQPTSYPPVQPTAHQLDSSELDSKPFSLTPSEMREGDSKISTSKSPKIKTTDPRHVPFRDELKRFYAYVNNLPKGEEYYWTKADAGGLGLFLRNNPKLDFNTFHNWLVRYEKSEINEALKPYEFLPRLHQYSNGPLNAYRTGPPKDKNAAF